MDFEGALSTAWEFISVKSQELADKVLSLLGAVPSESTSKILYLIILILLGIAVTKVSQKIFKIILIVLIVLLAVGFINSFI